MSSERFFLEISTPAGRIVGLGDRFINHQGIELAVSSIYRPLDCEGIMVEFAPVNSELRSGNWHNEILMDCEEPISVVHRIYSKRPSIALDRLDTLKALEDLIIVKKAVA